MTTDEIIAKAHRFGMIQNESEVRLFREFYGRLSVERLLEIGTHTGGFLSLLIEVGLPKDLVVSIDLPWQQHEYTVGRFREEYADMVKFIVGNSHHDSTITEVESILDRESFDFIFLDGDHSKDGCRSDFNQYWRFLRPGGWMGFHDINNGHGCGHFYWENAIKDREHVEFGYGRTFGIGCVRKPL